MTKSELIEALSQQNDISLSLAETIVNTFFGSIAEGLMQGERAEIRGFGSFRIRSYENYLGRNPRTGETVEVKPKKLPFFKVGRELKEKVDFEDI
jgi:integration host factor subunit beta